MFYYKITVDTPYCGTNNEHFVTYKEEPTTAELDELAEELSRDNAESYEYLVSGWDDEMFEGMSEEERADELEEYYSSCDGRWEQISEEEWKEEMGVGLD